jgi:hypothetical protein
MGLIISVTFGLIGQNRLTHVLVTGFISTIIAAALGAGVYKTIEIKVPELLSLFERRDEDFDNASYSDSSESGYQGQSGSEDGMFPDDGSVNTGNVSQEEDSSRMFGDHILVNSKIKIKNEPKLIAKAIQTMLAKDDG